MPSSEAPARANEGNSPRYLTTGCRLQYPLTPCEQADERCLFRRVQEVERRLSRHFGEIPAMKAGDEVLRQGLRLLSSGRAALMPSAERAALIWRTAVLTARRAAAKERRFLSLEVLVTAAYTCTEDEGDFCTRVMAAVEHLPEEQRLATTLHLLDGGWPL